jgi:type IX secretion system substrate protein
VVDPQYPQNIYVGNDLAVYVSTNNGANWFEYRGTMPYALIYDLTIVYPNRHIRATTHGNGVYERSLVQNPTGISQIGNEIPKSYSLSQNYPNPFNPETKIKFEIPNTKSETNSKTEIRIYDISGKLIETLVDLNLNPGKYEVTWSAAKYSSGVYFYKLVSGDYVYTKKMILVK